MKSVLLFFMLCSPAVVTAAAPDFFIMSRECKLIAGSLSKGGLTVGPGAIPTHGCIRSGKSMACSVDFEGDDKSANPGVGIYKILLDSPPFLIFGSEDGATYFSVNTESRAAVYMERLATTGFVAVKVCAALFVTTSELEMLDKR